MKKLLFTLACTLVSALLYAQNPEAIIIAGKEKIIQNVQKLGIAQYTVRYKQVSSVKVSKTTHQRTLIGKTAGQTATSSVTAYLETTNGELSDQDYQEITDYGYAYLQKKLKEAGIDTVAWTAITAADFYKNDSKEKTDDNTEKEAGEEWTTYNANKGNTFLNGYNLFMGMKMKRASRFSDDMQAPAAFFVLTVDFADIRIDLDVKTGGYKSSWTPSYNTVGQSTKATAKTSVAAVMKVIANGGGTVLWGKNMLSAVLGVTQDIPAEMDYTDGLSEDPSKVKQSKLSKMFVSKKLDATPVVITTTREKYKAAAKKALENYAESVVAKLKASKK